MQLMAATNRSLRLISVVFIALVAGRPGLADNLGPNGGGSGLLVAPTAFSTACGFDGANAVRVAMPAWHARIARNASRRSGMVPMSYRESDLFTPRCPPNASAPVTQ